MSKFLQYIFLFLFLFCCTTTTYANSEALTSNWEDAFIQKYTIVLQTQDSILYKSLVISQVEIDSLLLYLENTVPNCITDMERNLKEEKLTSQITQLKYYNGNVDKVEIVNKYIIAGCGNVNGVKINLKVDCKDDMTRHRTLTFITINETNKLLFDIEKN